MLNILTLGNRHSKEHFSDVLDGLKRSFSKGKSHERVNNTDLTSFQKSVS